MTPAANPPPSSTWSKIGFRLALVAGAIVLTAAVFMWDRSPTPAGDEISYTRLVELVEASSVESVVIRGTEVTGELSEPVDVEGKPIERFRSRLPQEDNTALLETMKAKGVEIAAREPEGSTIWPVLIGVAPWLLFVAVWLFMARAARGAMQRGDGPLASLTKGRARRFDVLSDVRVTMDDVAGLESAKRDLREVIDYLRDPKPFQRLGVKIPRGILLAGSPGVGKTLLARAVAGEAGVPFFSVAGSDFIEMFVGVGAARVRELFEESKKAGPSIVFIDEIDAVGRARGTGLGGGHDEREQTLNQLLNEMDGFTPNDRTVVLAATNRPDVLDAALLRPGRFDRRVVLDPPAREARLAILEVHTRDKPLTDDVDLDTIAGATAGFSGADLANVVNEAAMFAARRNADAVSRADFNAALDKVVLGSEREMVLSPEERRRIAVHESGHALVAQLTPNANRPRRVSIIPRGHSLGSTMQRMEADRHVVSTTELEGMLRVLMGGYAAERLVYDNVSTGAEDDLRKATAIAQRMVASYGMSEAIGPVHYELEEEHPFLGRRVASSTAVSDATTRLVEEQAAKLLRAALNEALRLLQSVRSGLDGLVARLLERETLADSELTDVLDEVAVQSAPVSGRRPPLPRAAGNGGARPP